MWAIVSDLHSNLPALEFVLHDIRRRGIPEGRILCLGDLIGYGPDPAEVLDLARRWPVCVRGNHDQALLSDIVTFNASAKRAIVWTRGILKPGFFASREVRERWQFATNLPLQHEVDGALLVHGSPRDPYGEYLRVPQKKKTGYGPVPKKVMEVFDLFPRLLFVGHTHEPGIITSKAEFLSPWDCDYHFECKPGLKYIINPGSVGQPRDRNAKASYLTWDGDRIEFHRVEYPIGVTQERIRRIPELDPNYAERLDHGK